MRLSSFDTSIAGNDFKKMQHWTISADVGKCSGACSFCQCSKRGAKDIKSARSKPSFLWCTGV